MISTPVPSVIYTYGFLYSQNPIETIQAQILLQDGARYYVVGHCNLEAV